MPAWVILVVVGAGFTALAAWASRRLLDRTVGWFRASATSLVVFLVALPLALWSLRAAGVLDEDGRVAVGTPIALSFIALTLGWLFAAVVVCVVTIEFVWPSGGWGRPVEMVRDALRRRDRARRYAEILSIASRHGLALFERRGRGDAPRELPAAIVAAANEAGVTFVKLGQMLSARDDVLPREIVDALATLQTDSTPIPWDAARQVVESELRRPITEVFSFVDPEPLAAASVAQVHAARLIDGQDVVLKIQRPVARRQVVTDVDILNRLAGDLERRTTWAREYGVVALVAEFSWALHQELDYRIELANLELVRRAGAASPWPVRTPRAYSEHSTERMLVMERILGTPVSRIAPGDLSEGVARAIADHLVAAVLDQVLVRGVFHADLHAGNVMARCDHGSDPVGWVSLVDYGAIGIVEKSLRRLLAALLIAMANEDDAGATDLVLLICTHHGALDKSALQRDIGALVTRVRFSASGEDIFRLLVDALRRHHLAIPPSLLLVLRTLSSLDGTLRRLSDGYNLTRSGIRMASTVSTRGLSLHDMAMTAEVQFALSVERMLRMGRRVENISRELDEGTFAVKAVVFDSADERTWVDRLASRLTVTVVGVTLVLAGVLLGVSDTGPELAGVPAVSVLGGFLGLGGILLLLRSLGQSFRSRGGG
ncbi:AarF/ABC1/UbiB kinase family protein [Microbacterium sp. CFH 31415]|uniref:ABC1 kinase family protein n=1 Tax=Microbacterium sp. CFH 31415 TaxID=2921732 RepID=UPI001F142A6F|nr:AarF/ABC1/UbiB kinase family protein [Microbacterium sp. CFH 31415]MCH6229448.1 AarF/ABC1/UbiB kinase family protein [Microbacterium sp. CFH 31415]